MSSLSEIITCVKENLGEAPSCSLYSGTMQSVVRYNRQILLYDFCQMYQLTHEYIA